MSPPGKPSQRTRFAVFLTTARDLLRATAARIPAEHEAGRGARQESSAIRQPRDQVPPPGPGPLAAGPPPEWGASR
jgi:hypothetical protein